MNLSNKQSAVLVHAAHDLVAALVIAVLTIAYGILKSPDGPSLVSDPALLGVLVFIVGALLRTLTTQPATSTDTTTATPPPAVIAPTARPVALPPVNIATPAASPDAPRPPTGAA